MSVAALGVYPYITSSIVMQILTPVVPQLKALSQEGEFGRQRINQFTHYLAVPIAIFQGFGQLTLLQQSGVLPQVNLGLNITTLTMIVSLVAGTMFLVWLGELITEKGIGNGISLIIFGGIVAGFPQQIGQGFLESDEGAGLLMLVILGFGRSSQLCCSTRPSGGFPCSMAGASSAAAGCRGRAARPSCPFGSTLPA